MEGSREGGHKVTDCLVSDASASSFLPSFLLLIIDIFERFQEWF